MLLSATAQVGRMASSQPRMARLAVATAFFVNGAAQASWVARIPAVQERLGARPGALGLALWGLPVGLLLVMPAVGWLLARYGSRSVTRAAALAYCAALPLLALAPGIAHLFAALLLFGACAGALDVAMNTAGAAVERLYGRPIMASFHGFFSVGGLAGAAAGGLLAARGVAPLPHLLGAGLALGAAALAASSWLLPAREPTAGRAPVFARPTRPLLGLGLVAFCVLLGEGAVADWGAVYLRDGLGADLGSAAVGFAVFSLAMAAGRLAGDRVNRRLGPVRLVRLGGAVAGVGALAIVAADRPAVAILGFAGVGLGFATVFPAVVSAAAREGSLTAGSAIAAATTAGYAGFLAGPPLIGLAAEAVSLRGGLGLVVLLCAPIALLARAVAPARPDARSSLARPA